MCLAAPRARSGCRDGTYTCLGTGKRKVSPDEGSTAGNVHCLEHDALPNHSKRLRTHACSCQQPRPHKRVVYRCKHRVPAPRAAAPEAPPASESAERTAGAASTSYDGVDLASIPLPTSDQSDELLRIRHSCAHIMAMAVQRVHRGAQVTVGPAIERGFFYDFDMSRTEAPFTEKVMKKTQKEMRRLIRKNLPFSCEEVSEAEARRRIEAQDEPYKLQILDTIVEKCAPAGLGCSLHRAPAFRRPSSSELGSLLCGQQAPKRHMRFARHELIQQLGASLCSASHLCSSMQGPRCPHHHLPHWAAWRQGALVGPVCWPTRQLHWRHRPLGSGA